MLLFIFLVTQASLSLTDGLIAYIIPAPSGPRNDIAETFGPSEVEGEPNEIGKIDVWFYDDRLRSVGHATWVSSAATARGDATATSCNRHQQQRDTPFHYKF